jgi:hypothetical protein
VTNKHTNKKKTVLTCIICLLVAFAFSGLAIHVFPVKGTITGTSPPASGDWVIAGTTTVENEPNLIVNGSMLFTHTSYPVWGLNIINSTLTINGNLTIYSHININIADSTIIFNSTGESYMLIAGYGTNTYCNISHCIFRNYTSSYTSCVIDYTILKMDTVDLEGFGSTRFYSYAFYVSGCRNVSIQNINVHRVNGSFLFYNPIPTASIFKNFTISDFHQNFSVPPSNYRNALDVRYANGTALDGITIISTYAGYQLPNGTQPYIGQDPNLKIVGDNIIVNNYIAYCKFLSPHFPIHLTGNNITIQNSYVNGSDNCIITPPPTTTYYYNNLTVNNCEDVVEAWNVVVGKTGWAIVSDSLITNSQGASLQSNLSAAFVRCNFINSSNVAKLASGNLTFTNCTFANTDVFAISYLDNPSLTGIAEMSQFWNFTDGTYIQLDCDEPTYQNANATLLTPSYSEKNVSYTLSASSGTLTSQVYCPLGEPYSVTGASSYSFDSETNTLTVTSSNSATVTVDYNVVSDAEESANTVFGNMYVAVGLIGVSLIVLACALIVKSLQSGIQGGLMFGVLLLIGSVVGLVVGFIIVARFEGSMDNLLFSLSTLRKNCY